MPRAGGGGTLTVVLTGATGGIGAAAAGILVTRCAQLVLHGPEPEDEVAGLLDRLRGDTPATVHYVRADYDRLDEVVALAARVRELVPRVDVLVNNAGRPGAPRRRVSGDGHEATIQTNYLAAVLLTDLLLPAVGAGRVVHVASATHATADLDVADLDYRRTPYDPVQAYARSKLAMVAHALGLAEERATAGTTVVSLSPGVIATPLLHAMFRITGSPPERGGHNVVDAALSPSVRSGDYLDDGAVAAPSARARDREFRRELHEATATVLRPWR